MRVQLSKIDIAYLEDILAEVDGVSYDPVYGIMIDRVKSTKTASGKNSEFNLEEFEIYSILEAFNYYSEMATKKDDEKEMRKLAILVKDVNEQTGLSL